MTTTTKSPEAASVAVSPDGALKTPWDNMRDDAPNDESLPPSIPPKGNQELPPSIPPKSWGVEGQNTQTMEIGRASCRERV